MEEEGTYSIEFYGSETWQQQKNIEEFQKENVVVAFSSDDPKDGEEKGQYGRNSDHPAQSDDPPVMPSVIWT